MDLKEIKDWHRGIVGPFKFKVQILQFLGESAKILFPDLFCPSALAWGILDTSGDLGFLEQQQPRSFSAEMSVVTLGLRGRLGAMPIHLGVALYLKSWKN